MMEDRLPQLITDCELQLDAATESAHRHPVPMEFEGSKTFSKEELMAVWAQGQKDAYRFVLTNLYDIRGY